MSNAEIRGRFIWHELMTTDPEAAGAFYPKVVPWKTQPSGMPSYTLWMAGKTQTGGLMALPDGPASGTPPSWLIYIGTPSVDVTVEKAQRLGGKVLKGATDIPNVGRFAVLADPQGAAFAVFTPSGAAPAAAPSGGPGEFSWHELATTDQQGAVRFYSDLFGWQKGPAHDMGPIGVYQLIEHAGAQIGGVYNPQGASIPPHWLSYVRVTDVDKAVSAAKAAGGRVLHGPIEVPGGSWIAMLVDPQGGAFAVHEPPRTAAAAKPTASKPTAAAKSSSAAEPAKPAPEPAASSASPAKKAAKKTVKATARGRTTGGKAHTRKTVTRKAAARKRPAAKRAGKSTSAKRGKSTARKHSARAKRVSAKSTRGKRRKSR